MVQMVALVKMEVNMNHRVLNFKISNIFSTEYLCFNIMYLNFNLLNFYLQEIII